MKKIYGYIFAGCMSASCLLYVVWTQTDLQSNMLSAIASQVDSETYTLDRYNQTYRLLLNVAALKEFLDNTLIDFGIDPSNFRYLVGDQWQARKLADNRYELIIPNNIPALADTHKMIFGWAYGPQFPYNIDDLDKTLKAGNSKRLDRYRVEIMKAIMGLKIKTVSEVTSSILGTTASAAALELVHEISAHIGYVLQGLQALYNSVAGIQDEEALQIDIDRRILKTHDIGLIEARIEELKELVQAQRGSIGRMTAWAYRTLLQSGESTYQEKRLALLETYLKENELELRLFKQFKNKGAFKKKIS